MVKAWKTILATRANWQWHHYGLSRDCVIPETTSSTPGPVHNLPKPCRRLAIITWSCEIWYDVVYSRSRHHESNKLLDCDSAIAGSSSTRSSHGLQSPYSLSKIPILFLLSLQLPALSSFPSKYTAKIFTTFSIAQFHNTQVHRHCISK